MYQWRMVVIVTGKDCQMAGILLLI